MSVSEALLVTSSGALRRLLRNDSQKFHALSSIPSNRLGPDRVMNPMIDFGRA